jgi:hypothetical protein
VHVGDVAPSMLICKLLLTLCPQVLSNGSVSGGVGVYWMFYSGGDFEPVAAPQGLPGAAAGATVEGLRMRPGLAMSQVRNQGMVRACTMRHASRGRGQCMCRHFCCKRCAVTWTALLSADAPHGRTNHQQQQHHQQQQQQP